METIEFKANYATCEFSEGEWYFILKTELFKSDSILINPIFKIKNGVLEVSASQIECDYLFEKTLFEKNKDYYDLTNENLDQITTKGIFLKRKYFKSCQYLKIKNSKSVFHLITNNWSLRWAD